MSPPHAPAPRPSPERRTWLDAHRKAIARQRERVSAVESRWSWGRLATFLLAVVGWYPLIGVPLLSVAAFLGGIVLFVFSVRKHLRVRTARELLDRVLLVIDESLRRCGGHVTLIRSFERPADATDPGAAVEPILERGPTWALTDQERDDLDLFSAPVGAFGLLNRTSTVFGSRRLRDWIENPCLAPERILARQAAVRWLAEHSEQRLRMLGAAAVLRGEDEYVEAFTRAVRETQPPAAIGLIIFMRWWSLPSGLFAVLAIVQSTTAPIPWLAALLALLVVNAGILHRVRKPLAECLEAWKNISRASDGYLDAARQAAADLPEETELGTLRAGFAAVVRQDVLPSLCRRVGWSEAGGAFHTLLNVLIFYDLHVAGAILKRVLPQRAALLGGLSALAELEALLSLACFAWEQPTACFPVPASERCLRIIGGRHPLIAPQRVVGNDVRLDADTRMWIITGSNMAGKSTLLRMVGVNVLLAQLGSAVAAEEMRWSPMCLMTDLRANDSLAKSESYFLAEVRHLRRMVIPPNHGAPLLGLIDEPFRGTNSHEQVAASIAVVRHLISLPDLFFVATHERRLTELADGRRARNFHFRENLDREGLVFDYRLRDGPARTRNALRVLEQEGYPAGVLEAAYEVIEGEENRDKSNY